MRKTIAAVVIAGLSAIPATAQYKPVKPNAPGSPVKMAPGVTPDAVRSVRRITVDEAVKLVNSGKAVYVDVRSTEQYEKGHIKGAISMPQSQMVKRLRDVPAGMTLITYCACSAEQSSGRAVLQLAAHGVKNAVALTGGWDAWNRKGLPTAVGKN